MNDELYLPDEPLWAEFRAQWKLERPPRIVVHGGYGKENLGDDAILQAILARIRREWPAAAISVLCQGPGWVQATHGVKAYSYTSAAAWRTVRGADLYIIGGGGIVDRINTYSGFRRLSLLDPRGKFQFAAAMLAQASGARVSFYCIGATSVPDPLVGLLARLAVGRSAWASVRDPLSARVLRRLGVRRPIPVTPDPANEIVAVPPERARQILAFEGVDLSRPLVALIFRYVDEPDIDNAATVAEVAQLTEHLIAEYNAAVLFVPFGRHPRLVVENDACFAAEVRARVSSPGLTVLLRPYSPAEVKGMLGLARVCVAERLHSVLLAATAGAPVVGVVYDDKVEQYMALAGLPARIPLREFTARRALQAIEAVAPALPKDSAPGRGPGSNPSGGGSWKR